MPPANPNLIASATRPGWRNFFWMLLCSAGVLAVLFYKSFDPAQALFANDGPLGANKAAAMALPEAFKGIWHDLNWVGGWTGSALPTLTYVLNWILGPVGFAKFYAPITVLVLGLSAWFFFRQLGFRPMVCLLGGLAAALNMDFFSYACWGLGTLPLCVAFVFLALAAVASTDKGWPRFVLAGFAVGMSVMEGFDNGAIFSLYISAFVVFQALTSEAKPGPALAKGIGRTACVAIFSGFIAAHALSILTGTQIKGIVSTHQDKQGREANWRFATQWSFPKIEMLRFLIPGLFGYGPPEMYGIPPEAYDGMNYWGSVGQDEEWEAYFSSKKPGVDPSTIRGTLRLSGSGEYSGVLVVLVAAWTIAQARRKKDSAFSESERKFIGFWLVMALVSLLLAFGRYAPFYRIIYALPYFSTIRNPVKWLHPFQLALIVLFGYGLEGLSRRYLASAGAKAESLKAHLKSWWASAPVFDRKWTTGCLIFLAASLLGWLVYGASHAELEQHLQRVFFPPQLAAPIAAFSLKEVSWYVLFLALSLIGFLLLLSGWFRSDRAKWAGLTLGIVLVMDLGRANLPWIVHYNYLERYASDPVLDILRDKPYEHRVVAPKFQTPSQFAFFQQIYYLHWLQYRFPYYNIQSLDIIQMPRLPEDIAAFQGALGNSPARLWQLTNTRYLLAWIGLLPAINQQLDPELQRFKLHTAFELYQKVTNGPILVRTNTTGPFALIEFTGALPRAKLYSNWQVSTNDMATLQQLTSTNFNPTQSVLVAGQLPTAPNNSTNQNAGTVTFKSYEPKRIILEADAAKPSVLLLNDRYDPQWNVWVDGRRDTLLRCNFHMHGVFLPAGKHTVEFRFEPPNGSFYISLAAIALGLFLCGFLAFTGRRQESAPGAEPTALSIPNRKDQNSKSA
ncbi:MAG: hypothetical protein ABI651_07275 [Verrucomicrobiota bacterium]